MPSDHSGDTYVARFTRMDHPLVQVGATPDVYWMGPPRSEWVETANDRAGHRLLLGSLPEGVGICYGDNNLGGFEVVTRRRPWYAVGDQT